MAGGLAGHKTTSTAKTRRPRRPNKLGQSIEPVSFPRMELSCYFDFDFDSSVLHISTLARIDGRRGWGVMGFKVELDDITIAWLAGHFLFGFWDGVWDGWDVTTMDGGL